MIAQSVSVLMMIISPPPKKILSLTGCLDLMLDKVDLVVILDNDIFYSWHVSCRVWIICSPSCYMTLFAAEVFVEVQPFVQSALDGFNVSIFAYGQTHSGKTHTMVCLFYWPPIYSQQSSSWFDIFFWVWDRCIITSTLLQLNELKCS